MSNKYLEKIASFDLPIANLKSSVTPVVGVANTASKGGVKGSIFGKAINPKPIPIT